jgi:hypothetical protein
MVRKIFAQATTAALLALVTSAMVDAQTPAPAPKPADKLTTIVGCLMEGNPANSPNGNDYFVRTPAIEVPVGGTVTVGKPGAAPSTTGATTTSAGMPANTALYRITGLDREKLRPHLGHRIELQGHLTGNEGIPGNTTAKTTVDANGRPRTQVETKMDIAGALHATTFKMIDANCR